MRLHLIITGYASNHNYAHAHIRADCARHGGFSHVIVEVSQSYLFISKTQKKVTSPTLVIVFFYQWSDKTTPT